METPQNVETCRWARMTINVPYPHWLEAEDKEWTCLRDKEPRPLDDPGVCHGCPRWEPRKVSVSELP